MKRADGTFEPIPGRFGLMPSHKRDAFSVAVSERYEVFQTEEMFAFCEKLRGAAGESLRFHTAGSLKGGSVVWLLAQLEGEINIIRRGGSVDQSAPFLMITNSFDLSSAIEIAATSVRVVCWNTLSAARRGETYSVRHTSSAQAQLAAAADALGLAHEQFSAYAEMAQEMAETPMNRKQFTAFAAQLLTGKDDEQAALEAVSEAKGRSEARLNSTFEALLSSFERGKGNRGEDRFDALNSVTEFIDHQRGRMTRYTDRAKALGADAKALDSAAFGSGAAMKERAVKLLTR